MRHHETTSNEQENETMFNRATFIALAAGVAMVAGATQGRAADIGVDAKKLIIVDKLSAADKAKTVYVSKDQTGVITKGTGTDVGDISVAFDFSYVGDFATSGNFILAAGASDGTSGWLVNKDTVAKYVNKNAPGAPTGAKVSVVKPGKLLKIVGKDLGDTPIDLIGAGAPTGDVCTRFTVNNGGESNTHCTIFPAGTYSFKSIANETGRKLVAKGGIPDPACACSGQPSVCGDGIIDAGEECDDANVDPTDGCTNTCTICGDSVVTAPEECDPPGAGCALNCTLEGCGNGLIEAGETCDDGNTADGDACPATCVIEACDAQSGTDFTVDVEFSGSSDVAGITVFLDYPEGQVSIPSSGDQIPSGIITDTPGFAFSQPNDLDYALREVLVDTFAFPEGLLFRLHFETCAGQAAPTAGDFTCTVEAAGDVDSNPIEGVTCSVATP
jgi:cysteine-rich repeat protein